MHPDLGHEFPPLRSLGAMPTNLPAQVSSFVGRDAEIAAVREAVREHRLVTLTGTGGCGKTRLALHAAADELDVHPDGVWCAELAAVAHGSDIAQTIAGVFGLREEFGRPLIDTLTEQLHDLDALLVVDNCEQVLDAAARMIESLLHACPQLARAGDEPRAARCRGRGGVACPVARSRRPRSRCSWSERNRPGRASRPTPKHRTAIDQIVDRLDGIPLALELAAARVRMMHPTRIAAALDDRFRLLTGGSRTAMPRQQTLEASVAWSYELLDDDEQALGPPALGAPRLHARRGGGDRLRRRGRPVRCARLVDAARRQVVDPGRSRRRRRPLPDARVGPSVPPGPARGVGRRRRRSRATLRVLPRSRRAAGAAPRARRRPAVPRAPRGRARQPRHRAGVGRRRGRNRGDAAIRDRADAVLGAARPSRARADGGSPESCATTTRRRPSTRARALWGAAHVALYGDDFETMQVRAPQALAMAESRRRRLGRGARVEHARLRRRRCSTRKPAAPSLARSIELGRAIGDDWAVADGWKMTTVAYYVAARRSRRRRLARRAAHASAKQLESEFFLAWYHSRSATSRRIAATSRPRMPRSTGSRSAVACVGDPSTGGFTEAWSLDARAATGDRVDAAAGLEALIARANAAGSGLAIRRGGRRSSPTSRSRPATSPPRARSSSRSSTRSRTRRRRLWVGAAPPRAAARRRRIAGDLDARAGRARRSRRRSSTPLGNDWLLALIEYELALVAHARGEAADAEDLLHSALGRQVRHDLRPGIAATLDALGALALDAESPSEAVRCFAAADALRPTIGLATATVRRGATRAAHRVGARAPRRRSLRAALDRGGEPVARRDDRVRLSGTRRTQASVSGMGQPHADRAARRRAWSPPGSPTRRSPNACSSRAARSRCT